MFSAQYKQLCQQVSPDEQLIQAAVKKAEVYEAKYLRKSFSWHKPAMAFSCICLCVFLAMPTIAARIEPIYQLMYLVSPAVAQFFKPVQKSMEDNGIKLEVVSAYVHENIAEIYITMQDLSGDRIDETIDLYDSYSIRRPFDSSAHCERIGYDANTKTATFLITIEEWNNMDITGDKLTFSVREFLSHKTIYEDVSIPIDLSMISVAEQTQTVSSNGGGGLDYKQYVHFEQQPIALVPTEPMSEFSIDGIDLTGIAYIDDTLHIQTAVKEPLDNDNHGYFFLKDRNGEIVHDNYHFSFSNQYEQPGRIGYDEYVFLIPQDEISQYTLHGYFVTSGMKTEGDWRVTFPLEKKV
jgi:hypothetical protein